MRALPTLIPFAAAALLVAASVAFVENGYFYSASYTVLLYVVLATAWNVLGGLAGYVNFGSAAFFALGAYTSIALHTLMEPPLLVSIAAGTAVAGLVGLAMGYLTLRLRGVFFAIATLALAQMTFILIVNWEYVGSARGAYVILPEEAPFGLASQTQFLFAVMALMAAGALVVARAIETSAVGKGLAAIRDDEVAAECAGVPTLRLKLVAATVSGALMGMAGSTFPYFMSYVEPTSVFSLSYAVNSIAMPLIGGMRSWLGPLVGALLLGTVQQLVQVTVSSEWNLLIVGVLLVLFVTVAPRGIMGWIRRSSERRGQG